jgi:hypothetical protein
MRQDETNWSVLTFKFNLMEITKLPKEIQYQIGMGILKADDADARAFRNKFQQKLNYLKQQRMIEITDKLFFSKFANGKGDMTIKNIIGQKPAAGFFCNLPLKELGITKKQIIAACLCR